MTPSTNCLIIAVLLTTAILPALAEEQTIMLSADSEIPRLTVHLAPEDSATGTAIIINPGGGYRMLAADHEGLQVARWLNRLGISAFVLRYRLLPDHQPSDALEDAKRAIRVVRYKADDYGISKRRIGMLGFSAGGHLTTAAGTQFDAGDPEAVDPIERESSRPDFLVPIYPAVSRDLLRIDMGDWLSTDEEVRADTPPTFLVHTHEDGLVTPKHSIAFYEALLDANVPAEFHIFAKGRHGTGLAAGDPDIAQWQPLMHNWLRRMRLSTDAERAAVKGSVMIEGEPLLSGWVTFYPNDETKPIAPASVGFNDSGQYRLGTKNGPCVGTYKIVVRRVAASFNDRQSGAYTLDDVEVFEAPGTYSISAGTNKIDLDL